MADWYYSSNGSEQTGPVTQAQLVDLFNAGELTRDSLVWREGLGGWLPLRRFFDELGLRDSESDAADSSSIDSSAADSSAAGSSAAESTASASTSAASAANPAPTPPPIPDPAPTAASPHAHVPVMRAPPPRSGMSGCAIALIVVAALAVPLLAILAAIAIPAYQTYVARSGIAGVYAAVVPLKEQVEAYQRDNGSCPVNASVGFKPAAAYAQGALAEVEFGQLETGNCGIEARMQDSRLGDGRLWLEYADGNWRCTSDLRDDVLPPGCRSH